jgi:hypothetical protein
VKKLTSEWATTIAAPAEFVANYILDVVHWEEMAAAIPLVSSVVKAPKCTWEGEPWRPGSVIAMRSAAIGIPMTVHCKVVEPEEGELCRYTQEMGLPLSKQTFTYSYSIVALAATTSELSYRAYVEGWAGRFAPTIRNPQWGPARTFASVIEEAWRHTQQSGTGQPPTAMAGSSTLAAPGGCARTCAACGAALAEEALFCHACGAAASDR